MSVKKNSEIIALKRWLPRRQHWKNQKNSLNTSDAEIFFTDTKFWAASVDTLGEEILWGLYRTPETVGWIAALQSLTDVTATGTLPQAALLAATWAYGTQIEYKKKVMRTYLKVLGMHGVALLGGDTGSSREVQLTTTALGNSSTKPLSRKGLRPGDIIVALGSCGNGPALGLRCVMQKNDGLFPEKFFRPAPDLKKFVRNKKLFRCAIDNSDGLASSLCILSQLNRVSFDVSWPEYFFTKRARNFCAKAGLPHSALFFAELGDYDFIAGVAPETFKKFQKKFPLAHKIAKVTAGEKPSRILSTENIWQEVPLDFVFNAPKSSPAEVRSVIKKWVRYSDKLKLP